MKDFYKIGKLVCSLFYFLLIFVVSCNQPSLSVITMAAYPDMTKSRLGETRYILHHPGTMYVEESRGKEGQLGFGLWLIDSVRRFTDLHGFVEIEHGKGIGYAATDEPSIEIVKSVLLNKTAFWPVTQTETGYFTSFVKIDGLGFSASAPRRSALDSVIAILSTLTKD